MCHLCAVLVFVSPLAFLLLSYKPQLVRTSTSPPQPVPLEAVVTRHLRLFWGRRLRPFILFQVLLREKWLRDSLSEAETWLIRLMPHTVNTSYKRCPAQVLSEAMIQTGLRIRTRQQSFITVVSFQNKWFWFGFKENNRETARKTLASDG